MKALLLLLITASTLFARFIPPTEDVQLFRRDALKLDANRQILLARDLITLANRASTVENSAQKRASAQLIALAANLAPESNAPLNMAKQLANFPEDVFVTEAEEDFSEPLANISRTVLYLLEDPNQKEHFAVAQLLLDPLATVAPDFLLLSARPSSDESPRWQKAVAPLASFVTPPPTPTKEAETTSEEMATKEKKDLPPEIEKKPFKKVADFTNSISLPLFLRNSRQDEDPFDPRIQAMRFEGKLKKQPEKIYFPRFQSEPFLKETERRVEINLSRKYSPELVAGIQGKFSLPSSVSSDQNGYLLALPMTILAEGLLSERQPIDNLLVLAELREDGTIQSPRYLWQFFEILLDASIDSPSRLLVAPGTKPLFISLLTQQHEDFFFDFDIFEVATLDEAFALSFTEAAPDDTSQAVAKFQEIREVRGTKSTSAFVANPHVLGRLGEVEELEPRYLSASLLKIRGAGDHPRNHSTKALAAIIESSLVPLANIPYTQSSQLKATSLETIHETCRANLDPLGRYVAMGDRKLYDQALDLANRIRTLARAKERYDSDHSNNRSLFISTYSAIREEYYQLATETSNILGQTPPANPSPPQAE